MGVFTDEYGQKKLEDFDDVYLEWYDPRHNLTRVRMLSGEVASVEDFLDYVQILLVKYQNHFTINGLSEWTLMFPYLVIQPEQGDQIFNKTKDEVYIVEHVNIDPYRGFWDKWVRLSGITPPDKTDELMWISAERYVKFMLAYPLSEAKPITEASGRLGDTKGGKWKSTVTARISRREPHSIGRVPFGDRKQIKSRPHETFRDPNDELRYSIEVHMQMYDNLVDFSCWDRDPLHALQLTNWLETFMELYTGTLKYNGINEILYWDRRDSEPNERWRDDIIGIRTRYFVRDQTIRAYRKRNLTRLRLRMRVAKNALGITYGGLHTGDLLWFGRVHDDTGGYLYGTFEVEDHGFRNPVTGIPPDGSYIRQESQLDTKLY